MGEAKLYVIPGSHPSRSAMLMLDRKGIPFKRVDLMPVISKGVLRAMRFPGVTVPALKLDGKRIQGSKEIARELDRIKPLPGDLDRIDGWIKDGVIGGGEPNAADFQIAPSVRLAMSFDDLRPYIEQRPAGRLAMQIVPDFPGRTPPVFPQEWLEGLRA